MQDELEVPQTPAPFNMADLSGQLTRFVRNAQLVVTKPNVASFDATLPDANWPMALIPMVLASLAQGLLGLFFPVSGNRVGTFLVDTLIGIFYFLILTGILYAVARFGFKGTSTLMVYVYALALINVPIYVISIPLAFIPVVGGYALLVLNLYGIYLTMLATASAHQLPMSRAVWAVAIPEVVLVLLGLGRI